MKTKLEKSEIIKRPSDFKALISQGKRISSKHITLYFSESGVQQYGFAVSRKVGNAVKRNKAKRRIKEVVRKNKDLLPDKKQIVVFVREGCVRMKFSRLEGEYANSLKKIV